jgi:plasmid stability protein
MAKLLIRDLDPELIERLKSRARQHGRSLHEEVKSILEAAAPFSMNEATLREGKISGAVQPQRTATSQPSSCRVWV